MFVFTNRNFGPVDITVPRDRDGTFELAIVRKWRRRLDGLNDAIISLYARGMTVRDIRAHLTDIDGVEVSPDLISKVTEAVADEVTEWQKRPLGFELGCALCGRAMGQDPRGPGVQPPGLCGCRRRLRRRETRARYVDR